MAKKVTAGPDVQPTLDVHLKDIPLKEVIITYSHELFREMPIEWLVATDQPIDALEHLKFVEMIEISARAKDGVRIPGRKSAREEILNTFQKRLDHLKAKLNVRLS
ncbi:hypothetical protein B0H10DRAFT_1822983 [Mycena sp. CBHHK59/15]|nr:hypothetical protein B0H10DRAFT_1822983 [Mycena sp. CBHHK59/15]